VISSFFDQYKSLTKGNDLFSFCLGPKEGHLLLGGTNDIYKNESVGKINIQSNKLNIFIGNGTVLSFPLFYSYSFIV
jgi:hypothetical protein